MEKQSQYPMVYISRHSERCDLTFNLSERSKIERSYDSPITTYGHEIAYKTGLFFKREMARLINEKLKNKNMKFCIVSSPYYRCLQTSLQFCKAIGFENIHQKKLFVEDAIEEWHLGMFVPEEIKEKRFFPKNWSDEKNNELFTEITPVHNTLLDYDNNPDLISKYDEEKHDGCMKRFSMAYDTLIEDSYKNPELVYICVTHGISLDCI